MGKCFHWIIGGLSSNVFELRTSTGSELVFSFIMPWRHQICMAKCLYPYGDDLPKSLFKITAQEGKKVHFWLTCVAQKRRCLNCLITHRSLTWLSQVQHGYQSPAERKPLKRNSAGTAKVVSRTEKSSKRDVLSMFELEVFLYDVNALKSVNAKDLPLYASLLGLCYWFLAAIFCFFQVHTMCSAVLAFY